MLLGLVETAVQFGLDDAAQLREVIEIVHLRKQVSAVCGGFLGGHVAEVVSKRAGEVLEFGAELGGVPGGVVDGEFGERLREQDAAAGDHDQPHQGAEQQQVEHPGQHGRGCGEFVADGDGVACQQDYKDECQADEQRKHGFLHISDQMMMSLSWR